MVDKGLVPDVNQPIAPFFPQEALLVVEKKKSITMHYLLTMTSGLQWNEQDMPYSNPRNDIVQLFIVPDPVKYILSKPMIHEPGCVVVVHLAENVSVRPIL